MKTFRNNLILFLCLTIFVMIFKFSPDFKISILSSIEIWFTNLIPTMLPIYIISDLLINYGFLHVLYSIFRTNSVFLVIMSLISGTPSNAKYISEFYKNGYIPLNTANFLLTFAYSPNPLFILGISENTKMALTIIGYIYIMNIIMFLIFRKKFKNEKIDLPKPVIEKPFSECLENSIYKSFKILVLILGVVIIYGVINTFLSLINVQSVFLSSILEMTNAIFIINEKSAGIKWLIFACSFAGLSIHTQIKSILEDTGLSYRYFLFGRLLSSIPILLSIIFGI